LPIESDATITGAHCQIDPDSADTHSANFDVVTANSIARSVTGRIDRQDHDLSEKFDMH